MTAHPIRFARGRAVWSGLLLAVMLVLSVLGACADYRQVFAGRGVVNFVDADCYSRMTRVREVCRHPGAVIRQHDFENYPSGTRPHTTVLLDDSIWALQELPGVTTDVAGAWISPVFGFLTILGLWLWLRAGDPGLAWPTLLLVAASPIMAHGFALGRPDHQSLVVACMAWALAAEWAQWHAPSRRWGIVSGAAWALGLWTSLYEPVILLAITLLAGLLWNRAVLFRRERLPGLAVGGFILLLALWIEGWRIDALPGFGEGGGAEYFAAWSRQIGELASVPPWSATLYQWCGLGLIAAPVLLCLARGADRAEARAHLLHVGTVFALTCWQVRWGYFLPLVYAMSLPAQFRALAPRWRTLAAGVLLLGLFPLANEWRSHLWPTSEQAAARAEQAADATQLREVAAFIRQGAADAPVDSSPNDDGEPNAGILAPWWLSPALAYWSGQPALAGSSHESLPGTVDTARFFVSADLLEISAILRHRRVRWIVSYEPERVLQTAGPLLGKNRVSNRCMGELLYRHPESAPRFLRLAMANPYFKVYEVRSALLPPPA